MLFGVHVSIGKGLVRAVQDAKELGCDGFQIFVGNPRGWDRKPLDSSEIEAFKKNRSQAGLYPVVVHLSYLPNLASEQQDLYEKSVLTLAEDFRRANQLEADFFVFHPGKNKQIETGLERITQAVNLVLEKQSGPTVLLFENQAGAGSELASRFQELGKLINSITQTQRVGICFDTCHGFAAGYDLRDRNAWEKTLDELEQNLGLEQIKLFHLNDSMGNLGSHLDRHQHIGAGMIGLDGFRYLVNHPQLSKVPGILETPQQTAGDDCRNLAVLRGLFDGANL